MKIEVGEFGIIELREVFNSITLKTEDGEQLIVCMRDSGFELNYATKDSGFSIPFELKKGELRQTGTEGGP